MKRIICSPIFFLGNIFFLAMVVHFSRGIVGNDFWWHVKAGEWIVQHGQIPYTDVFSWYGVQEGLQWVSHEWLSEVIFYWLYQAGGQAGIFVCCMAGAMGMLGLVLWLNRQDIERSYAYAAMYLGIMMFWLLSFFYGRPHIFSFWLFFAELYCLYKFKSDEHSKVIYAVPFIALLWSNLHGGSSNLAYLLCFFFALCGCWSFSKGKLVMQRLTNRQLKAYLSVGALAALAILINPHGTQMLIYPYANMADKFMLSFISEWQSPDGKSMFYLIGAFVPIFGTIISLLMTRQKIELLDLMLYFGLVCMFLRSQRFIALLMSASAFIVFRYLPDYKMEIRPPSMKKVWFMLVLNICGIVGICYAYQPLIAGYQENGLISREISTEMIEQVKADKPERIYNSYNYGAELIANGIPVFVDGRADLYSKNCLKDAIGLQNLYNFTDKGAVLAVDEIIKKYDFDTVLIEKASVLNALLQREPERFEKIFADEVSIYYRIRK